MKLWSAEERYKKISKDQKRKAAGGQVEVEGRGGWEIGHKVRSQHISDIVAGEKPRH
jgi:hypothetical protein